jgi:hypothetical protein
VLFLASSDVVVVPHTSADRWLIELLTAPNPLDDQAEPRTEQQRSCDPCLVSLYRILMPAH